MWGVTCINNRLGMSIIWAIGLRIVISRSDSINKINSIYSQNNSSRYSPKISNNPLITTIIIIPHNINNFGTCHTLFYINRFEQYLYCGYSDRVIFWYYCRMVICYYTITMGGYRMVRMWGCSWWRSCLWGITTI